MDLEGKVAIVTGAARGIGKAIARRLAQEGATVAVCDLLEEILATAEELRSEVANQALEKSLSKRGLTGASAPVVLPLQVDVTDLKAVESAVKTTIDELGRVDILVNNAGIVRDALLVRMKESDWDAVIAVNLKGAFNFSKAVARTMMKQRAGRIVNISSVMGIMGNAGQANYSASKAGIIGLTKSTAKELGSRGINVNAIAPGFIMSKMTESLPEEQREKALDAIPLGSIGYPEDVANAVAFLVSDSARYITGQVIQVDGGLVM
jgi:3-oxoacyl-[acyl-carrier protein] reductase